MLSLTITRSRRDTRHIVILILDSRHCFPDNHVVVAPGDPGPGFPVARQLLGHPRPVVLRLLATPPVLPGQERQLRDGHPQHHLLLRHILQQVGVTRANVGTVSVTNYDAGLSTPTAVLITSLTARASARTRGPSICFRRAPSRRPS